MSLKVKTLVVGQLQTNCYLVIDGKSEEAIIIDPGDDADYIIRILSDLNIKPKEIIATHGHFDHVLGVTELKFAYKIPFLIHKADEFLLERQQATAKHFLEVDVDPASCVDKYLKEGDEIKLGKFSFKVIETPGHTPGSISLYCKEAGIVFVGDVIFEGGGRGRTDFAYSDEKELINSIKKLLKLPGKTKVYSGHGNEARISSF
ncbi:MAG: MBL fold metallo-hydrolase [Patescibacteria group bacterium]